MRKILLSLALFLCAATLLQAQSVTVVGGKVQDTNGLAYFGATMTITATYGGQSYLVPPVFTITHPDGSFTVNIVPVSGATYAFAVSFPGIALPLGTGPQICTTSGITISGSTQTVTFSSCPALTNVSGSGGSIGGSIASGQVAFGSGTNTIQGTANATMDTSGDLTLAGILSTPGINLTGAGQAVYTGVTGSTCPNPGVGIGVQFCLFGPDGVGQFWNGTTNLDVPLIDTSTKTVGHLASYSATSPTGTLGDSGVSVNALAPNQGAVYVVNTSAGGSCGTQPHCYAVTGNIRATADGGTTNTSPTVTSATANFTAADIGRIIYVINPANGVGVQIGTIQTINSATSVQSSANSTATLSGNGVLAIGTDDAPNFKAAYQAAVAAGQGISIPCGAFLLDSNPPVFAPSAITPAQNYSISGCSPGGNNNSTLFVVGPALLASNVDGIVFQMPATAEFPFFGLGGDLETVSNFKLTGLGAKGTASYTVILAPAISSVQAYDFQSQVGCNVAAWTSGEAHFSLLNIQTDTQFGDVLGGCIGASIIGQGNLSIRDSIFAFTNNTAIQCEPSVGSNCNLDNNYVINEGGSGSAAIHTTGSANIVGGQYTGNGANVIFDEYGVLNIYGAVIEGNGASDPIPIFGGSGVVHSRDTSYSAYEAADFFGGTSGTFVNEGGNSFSVAPTTTLFNLMATATESGTGTCATNAATITYVGTYLVAPVVVVTDYVSGDTAGLNGAPGTTTATVHCSGASDAFGYTVTPNYF